MTEKPILFSTEMVRAILEDRKTMTRRVVKPQPEFESGYDYPHENELGIYWKKEDSYDSIEELIADMTKHARYQPGDILWVRETWYYESEGDRYVYKASSPDYPVNVGVGQRGWRPSIHMPRKAARLFLVMKDVRVEMLQDVTEDDARAEGVDWLNFATAKEAFTALWDFNGKKHPWESNPYVWVISFERRVG